AALHAPAAAAPARPAGNAAPSNNDIHAAIQNAIAAQPDLKDVSVAVNYDQVTLTGSVPNQTAKKLAAQIAQADAGERKIVNALKVKKPRIQE
ncbi:MAG: BON domain-containing protein, partial [Terriglobales bacterium]